MIYKNGRATTLRQALLGGVSRRALMQSYNQYLRLG